MGKMKSASMDKKTFAIDRYSWLAKELARCGYCATAWEKGEQVIVNITRLDGDNIKHVFVNSWDEAADWICGALAMAELLAGKCDACEGPCECGAAEVIGDSYCAGKDLTEEEIQDVFDSYPEINKVEMISGYVLRPEAGGEK